MTVLDIIVAAESLIGSLGVGETPNSDDAAVGFFELNNLIDELNTSRLNLFTTLYYSPALTPTVAQYSIGPGASNFSTSFSVVQIQTAACIIPGTSGRKDIALINAAQYASIGEKNIQAIFPDKLDRKTHV